MNLRKARVAAAAGAASVLLLRGAAAESFIGANFIASTRGADSTFIPPDTMGAAGVDHYVEFINGRYAVYRKSDGVRVQTSALNGFWSDAGAAPTSFAFDPRILYDMYSRRWFALAADNAGGLNSYLLAVSQSSDPTAGWTAFKIDSDASNTFSADFPMLGINANSVALSANMFIGGTLARTGFVVVPKADLLLATPTVANKTSFENLTYTGTSAQPAIDLDNGTAPLPMLSTNINVFAASIRRTNIGLSGGSGTITPSGQVVNYSVNTALALTAGADQPGPKANIHVGDTRIQANPVLNNGEIWAVANVDSGGRAAINWYRLNASDNTVIEQGTISDPSLYLMRPSIAVNDLGDVVIGFSATSPAVFVSTYYVTGKTAGGTTTFGSAVQTRAGVSDYERLDTLSRNRWGDYSATSVDPADPSIFWTIQEFVSATDVWSDQVSELILPQASEERWKNGTDGAFTTGANWLSGASPSSSSHVIFSRSTAGTNGYTATIAAPQTIDRLSFRQGQATLLLSNVGLTVANSSAATPSVIVGEFGGAPIATIAAGSLSAVNTQIAPSSISHGTLQLIFTRYNNSGGMYVGGTASAAGGTGTLSIDVGSSLQVGGELRVWPGGTVSYSSGSLSSGLLSVDGGKVLLGSAGGLVLHSGAVSVINGGKIDLYTNYMIVDNATLDSIRALIQTGFANGSWNGNGMTSSRAALSPSGADEGKTGLGFAQAAALGLSSFAGFNLDPAAILIEYAYAGDANLDGTVDITDLGMLASHWQTASTWIGGDFDYSGVVDANDLGMLALNWQAGAEAPLGSSLADALASLNLPQVSVPEPGALLGMALLARRRRRRD